MIDKKLIKYCWFGFLILIVIFGVMIFWPIYKDSKNEALQKNTIEQFITNIITNNPETAQIQATGSVLANIQKQSNLQQNNIFTIVNIKVDIQKQNDHWAQGNVQVETKDSKGIVDVHWYQVYLINNNNSNSENNTWLIYRIAETDADLKGIKEVGAAKTSIKKVVNDAQIVFNEYITCLANNQYEDAGKWLIGRARTSHQQAGNILGKAPVVSTVGEIEFTPLLAGKKDLVAKVEYVVDKRKVSLAISFYLTSEGWRIYNVVQI